MKLINKTILVGTTMLFGTALLAADLNNQVDNLQIKLQRIQTIQKLQQQTKDQNLKMTELEKNLKDTCYALSKANERINTENITIKNLSENVKSLRQDKQQQENQLFTVQSQSTSAFKKEIDNINQKAQEEINKYKEQYRLLETKNNQQTMAAKAALKKQLAQEKQLYCEKINALISTVNNYEDSLTTAAHDLYGNANKIGEMTAKLKAAYRNAPNPFGARNLLNQMITEVGLKSKNPSWTQIQTEVKNIRDNASTIRGVSDDLNKNNLTSTNILKKNQENDKGLFWGLI